jgi:flagellar hook-associated protein 3 FlgL
MRLSTSMIHGNAVRAMQDRQSDMSKTQKEVASGLRINKPSDDPVAMVRILQLEQAKLAGEQYGTNIAIATTRLEQEEQALADSGDVLQRVYELTIQANSSALGQSERYSIASELEVLNKQLLDIANRKDSNGEFIFAGLSSATQPFVRAANSSMSYAGDTVTRSLQIGDAQFVADASSGQEVFMSVPQGNGTFFTTASVTNAGTGVISGAVQNAAAWVVDDFTLSFSSATDWQITDSSAAVVASGGGYVPGTAIAFNGIQVSVTGAAATGDSFSIDTSRQEDIFTTIDSLIETVRSTLSGESSQALFQNHIGSSLQQLDQAVTHFSNVRTGVGARMSLLQSVESTRQDSVTQIDSLLSSIRDTDYAEAVSRLTQQTLGLQAAQQSYVKIAQLSLFNYL